MAINQNTSFLRVNRFPVASRPSFSNMEPPNIQGGGITHASPLGGGIIVVVGMIVLRLLDTLTPSFWKPLECQGPIKDRKGKERLQKTPREAAGYVIETAGPPKAT